MNTIAQRVAAGVAYLDRTHGPQWVFKIDTVRLDLNHNHHCILGQIYGDFLKSPLVQDNPWPNLYQMAADFGFYSATLMDADPDRYLDWNPQYMLEIHNQVCNEVYDLKQEWTNIVAQRRQAVFAAQTNGDYVLVAA